MADGNKKTKASHLNLPGVTLISLSLSFIALLINSLRVAVQKQRQHVIASRPPSSSSASARVRHLLFLLPLPSQGPVEGRLAVFDQLRGQAGAIRVTVHRRAAV